MFEVLKTSVLLQKVHRLEAMVMQPEDALEMACRGGAAAFGLPDLLGALEPGRKADLILVDLRSPFVAPVHRVASALVFCCTPRDVRSVIVDGRPLIRDGELLTAEESEVIGRAEVACRNLFARLG
jgi:5-methylthioadenosine/S-adenosylhomocysteine deaminase